MLLVIRIFHSFYPISFASHGDLYLVRLRWRWRRTGFGISDSQDGFTALMGTAEEGRAACARLLIDAGADKDAKNNVRTRSRPMIYIDKFTLLAVFDMFTLFLYLAHGA
jgi:hypothetical protein